MFWTHPNRILTGYCDGALPPRIAGRVEIHLLRCARCRSEVERLRRSMEAVRRLPVAAAPEAVWSRIEAAIEIPAAGVRATFPRRSALLLGACAAAAGVVFLLIWPRSTGPGARNPGRSTQASGPTSRESWEVVNLGGTPTVGLRTVVSRALLREGEWLQTDARSRARVKVADIGEVRLESNSRLRLVSSRPSEHRMRLEQGKLRAKVNAPPRLFLVETPSALAVDLGCAYTLETLPDGSSRLRVTSGRVAFEWQGRESIVLMGAACDTRRGRGPGTPYFEDSRPQFIASLRALDDGAYGPAAVSAALESAKVQDAYSLWHLIQRLPEGGRPAVYRRMAQLIKPPAQVKEEDLLSLNPAALEGWRTAIEEALYPGSTMTLPSFIFDAVQTQSKARGEKK